MTDIPKPDDSGVIGTQEPGTETTGALVSVPPMQSMTMTQAIEGLAATRPRSLGGDVSAAFVAAAMSQTSQELQATRQSLQRKEDQLQLALDDLTVAKVEIARLNGHLDVASSSQRLRRFSIFAGTALLGVAVDLYKNNYINMSYLIAALGAGLLLFGWLSPSRGGSA